MTSRRQGFQLVEVLVALAIAAGPMFLAVHMIQQNSAGARFNHDRAMERLILLDLAEILSGEPVAKLATLPDHPEELAAGFTKRLALMPESVREGYRQEVAPYLGRIQARFTAEVDPAVPGLSLLTLELPVEDKPGVTVTVTRLFRPAARLLDREVPVKST